jgi:hypothetical protein
MAKRYLTHICCLAVASALLVGCTGDPAATLSSVLQTTASPSSLTKSGPSASSASGIGSVQIGGLRVDVGASLNLIAEERADPAAQSDRLDEIATELNGQASRPVELTASASLPAGGAVLTRTYLAPLPDGAIATFAYFDTARGLWTAVPSVLSADRTTLTATVSHFSLWDDIWFNIGQLTDQRVAKPVCSGQLPSWLTEDNGVLFADDQNLPLLWCAERTTEDKLLVKVRVNRGYGIALHSTTAPEKSTNSFIDADIKSIYKWITDATTQAAATSTLLHNLLEGNSQEVPGKAEATYTFTEQQVRSSKEGGVGIVYAEHPPSPVQAAMAVMISFAQQALPNRGPLAITAALLTFVHCEAQVFKSQEDFAAFAHTMLSCVYEQANSIIGESVDVAQKASPAVSSADLKADADKVIRSFLRMLAVGYFGISLGQYLIDVKSTDRAAYAFSAYPAPLAAQAPSENQAVDAYKSAAWVDGGPLRRLASDNYVYFKSPSGNIVCSIADEVICEVKQREFGADPRPATCPTSESWVQQYVSLTVTGVSAGYCTGGMAVPFDAVVLPYGKSLTWGAHTCSSGETGVTCSNASTGHGFKVSRSRIERTGPTTGPPAVALTVADYVGEWSSKFTSIAIRNDSAGTFVFTVPCCMRAEFPISVTTNSDGSLTGWVTGPARREGGITADLPVGSQISIRFKPGRAGDVVLVHSNLNLVGVESGLCADGISDPECVN